MRSLSASRSYAFSHDAAGLACTPFVERKEVSQHNVLSWLLSAEGIEVPTYRTQQQAGVRSETLVSFRFVLFLFYFPRKGSSLVHAKACLSANGFAHRRGISVIVLPSSHSPFVARFPPAPICVVLFSRLKNEASMFSQTVRSFNMQHRLLLTGTPLQVTGGKVVVGMCI